SSSPSFGRSPARLEDEVRPVWGVVGLSATRSCRGGTSSCLRRRFTPTGTARRAQCFSRCRSCWRSHLPSSDLDARSLRLSLRGGLRLRSRVAFRLNCDTVWHGFATESPRHPVDTVAESLDHRPERRPALGRRPKGALHVAAVAPSPSRTRSPTPACPDRGWLKIGSAAEAFRQASFSRSHTRARTPTGKAAR